MMRCVLLSAVAAFFVASINARLACAENWPQWRGPRLDNVSLETGVPTKWSKTENVVWRMPMPGPGGATPVFWNKHIFVTSARGEDLLLLALDTKGKLLWEQVMATGNKDVRGDEGNSAAPSPATDGKHVRAMMATGEIGCYDFAGKEIWKFNLQDRYGRFSIAFGLTSTPILDGDRLYVQLIHGEGKPATREAVVVCLDKATGNEIWKADRPSDAHSECEHSYASPTLYRDANNREFLITHGADFVVAYNLKDGTELWRCGGLNPKVGYNPTLRFVASPAAVDGLIVVPSAKGGPVLGLSPDAKGDITESAASHVWTRAKDTPDVPTPLIHEGLVYLCRENGNLLCLDAKTGEEIYYETTHRQRHRASPVYADGKVFCTARDGVTHVIKAGRAFEILAKNEIGESIAATPVFFGGKLYLRSYDALYCIGK